MNQMENLNDLELTLLNHFAIDYPFFKSHIAQLSVTERIVTGVGMFIHFSYLSEDIVTEDSRYKNICLATNDNIQLNNLEYGLAYEICITNSKIEMIELVTYDEAWDGKFETFKIQSLL